MLVEYVCHGSVTLCNGKTLRIPKNIGEDNNRGLSFPQKNAKGLAYICICPKILFMIDQRIVGVEVCPLLPFLASLHIYIPVH